MVINSALLLDNLDVVRGSIPKREQGTRFHFRRSVQESEVECCPRRAESKCGYPRGVGRVRIGLRHNEHYLAIRVLDGSSRTMAAAAAP